MVEHVIGISHFTHKNANLYIICVGFYHHNYRRYLGLSVQIGYKHITPKLSTDIQSRLQFLCLCIKWESLYDFPVDKIHVKKLIFVYFKMLMFCKFWQAEFLLCKNVKLNKSNTFHEINNIRICMNYYWKWKLRTIIQFIMERTWVNHFLHLCVCAVLHVAAL